MLVSKPTHGGGAPLGIDLDGGTAKITITPKKAPEDSATAENRDAEPREPEAPPAD